MGRKEYTHAEKEIWKTTEGTEKRTKKHWVARKVSDKKREDMRGRLNGLWSELIVLSYRQYQIERLDWSKKLNNAHYDSGSRRCFLNAAKAYFEEEDVKTRK